MIYVKQWSDLGLGGSSVLDGSGRHPRFRNMLTLALTAILKEQQVDMKKLTICMTEETALAIARSQECWDLTGTWPHEGKENLAAVFMANAYYGLGLEIGGFTLEYGSVALRSDCDWLWKIDDAFGDYGKKGNLDEMAQELA